MTITEKVAYLKGLADGMELDKETSKEAKLLKAVVDVLEEIGYSIEDLEESNELLSEGLDAISEDLEDVESLLFDEDDCDCDCDCDDEDDDFFEIACPSCGKDLVVDEDVLEEGEITCPNCDTVFALDLVQDDDLDDDDD